MNVALKRLDNSQNISSSYIDQVQYLSFPSIGKKGPA
jgi:hypothetical protein